MTNHTGHHAPPIPKPRQTIRYTEPGWWRRECRHPDCTGTASALTPSEGQCIYLRDGENPCGFPYDLRDWKQSKPVTRTGKVTKVRPSHDGTETLVYIRGTDQRGAYSAVTTWSRVTAAEVIA